MAADGLVRPRPTGVKCSNQRDRPRSVWDFLRRCSFVSRGGSALGGGPGWQRSGGALPRDGPHSERGRSRSRAKYAEHVFSTDRKRRCGPYLIVAIRGSPHVSTPLESLTARPGGFRHVVEDGGHVAYRDWPAASSTSYR